MAAKRFITYFGTPIPPWKETKLGAGSTTIRFVITGKVPSKKNNQQAVTIRKKARDYLNGIIKLRGSVTAKEAQNAIGMTYSKMRSNKEYNEFILTAKPIIQDQMLVWSNRLKEKKGLVFPISKAAISLRFYFNNRYVTDTVNKQQTIQDLLVECGVVMDDDYDTLNPIVSASQCYAEEIVESIAFISVSFRLRNKK